VSKSRLQITDCRLLIEDPRSRIALGLVCGLLLFVACRTPLPGPAPVTLRTPAADALVQGGNVTFTWDTVAGATSYELQVDDKATFITPVADTSGITVAAASVFLPDGDYHWRARGRGQDSVWGDWSEVRGFELKTMLITAQIQTRGYPQAVDVRGDYAFVADGEAGLSIYDVSDPDSLKFAASIMDTTNSAFGVSMAGHYAYLAYGRKQIQVVDITRLDSMKMLGSIGYTTGYAYDIEALDTTMVVVANHGKFSVFDVTDPNFPILLYEPHSPARSVVVRNMTAYLACEQVGVQIATISKTIAPVTLSIFRTPGNARDVAVAGNYAYVADGREGLSATMRIRSSPARWFYRAAGTPTRLPCRAMWRTSLTGLPVWP
jgi:hypothetical protein